ncbi:Uncharacterised protein, partial [Mesomycoplasma hyorhinis]
MFSCGKRLSKASNKAIKVRCELSLKVMYSLDEIIFFKIELNFW